AHQVEHALGSDAVGVGAAVARGSGRALADAAAAGLVAGSVGMAPASTATTGPGPLVVGAQRVPPHGAGLAGVLEVDEGGGHAIEAGVLGAIDAERGLRGIVDEHHAGGTRALDGGRLGG